MLRQLLIPGKAALQQALEAFTLFYNHVRPHQNLGGLTPAEAWNGYSQPDLAQTPPKHAALVQALNGLLVLGIGCEGSAPARVNLIDKVHCSLRTGANAC